MIRLFIPTSLTDRMFVLQGLIVAALVASCSLPAEAAVTYVDATLANTDIVGGGADSLWVSGDDGTTGGVIADGGSGSDDLWRFRTGQGSNGVFEALGASPGREDAVEIVTTATGLANGLYDAYVFYGAENAANSNWKIRAGSSSNPNANTLYDRTGADGIAGFNVFSGSDPLSFDGTPPVEDTGQPLRYANIGRFAVSDGTLSVFIDDFPASLTGSSLDRTWYDGIGYELFIPPVIISSVQSGPASLGSTWSNSMPASAGQTYHVLNSHTVDVAATFPGDVLDVMSGGTVNVSQDAVNFNDLIIRSGGNLTKSVSGDFALGDINAPGKLTLEQDIAFSLDAGAAFFLDVILDGEGNLDFNATGSGSDVYLTAAGGHDGVIRFNGLGNEVRLDESGSFNVLEMSSTAANRVVYAGKAALNGGTLVFNEPGVIDHASSQIAPPSTAPRLQSMRELEVNAEVTVDLTKTFSGNERRLFINSELRGSGNIVVNGTATDPTGGDVTHNEFEVGSTGQPSVANTSPYSGTISTNDFVDLEIRANMPNARFEINSNGRLEMGWQAIVPNQSVILGEVQIHSGGTLEVGYEDNGDHNVRQLRLTSSGSRTGSLTLGAGSTTILQVNGTAATEFDSIVAEGDVSLSGTVEVLINPAGSGGTNPIYAVNIGDTFDIITTVGDSPTGDYDGSGVVDGADYTQWRGEYGSVGDFASDGNGDGVVDAADYTLWRDNLGGTGSAAGNITGVFANLSVVDDSGALAAAGAQLVVNYVSSTLVQLQVVSAGIGAPAVPEPGSLLLIGMGVLGFLAATRRQH